MCVFSRRWRRGALRTFFSRLLVSYRPLAPLIARPFCRGFASAAAHYQRRARGIEAKIPVASHRTGSRPVSRSSRSRASSELSPTHSTSAKSLTKSTRRITSGSSSSSRSTAPTRTRIRRRRSTGATRPSTPSPRRRSRERRHRHNRVTVTDISSSGFSHGFLLYWCCRHLAFLP